MDPLSEFLELNRLHTHCHEHCEDEWAIEEEDCGNEAFFF
jgi:hypothetical protein